MKVPYPPADGNWDWNDFHDIAKKMTVRNASGQLEQSGALVNYVSPQEDNLWRCFALQRRPHSK